MISVDWVGFEAMDPLRFVLVCLAGWINRQQQDVIAYLNEEVAVLKEQIGRKESFH